MDRWVGSRIGGSCGCSGSDHGGFVEVILKELKPSKKLVADISIITKREKHQTLPFAASRKN